MDYKKCPDLDKNLPLATAFVRVQCSSKTYKTPKESICHGTVFPVLYNAGYSQPTEKEYMDNIDDPCWEDPICHTNK